MKWQDFINISNRKICLDQPTYFIADIASNHDGVLDRAKLLIWLAKGAGADAVKFQHFKAEKIVSDIGFKNLGKNLSHQVNWENTVFETYKKYECNRNWTSELVRTAQEAKIDLFTTPYDIDAVNIFKDIVPAFKIGSGDITWTDFLETIAKIGKPIILSTGASNLDDVDRAVKSILKYNKSLAILQCNTNYTGSIENFHFLNLNVLKTFSRLYHGMVIGLSDHTPGYTAVLGAIALGARIIEKHFTDDNSREGPDHSFSMNPESWKEMIQRSRELEASLGDGIKKVEENEKETFIIQRRCLRLKHDKKAFEKILLADLEVLRPAPINSIPPYRINEIVGKYLKFDKKKGEAIYEGEIE